MQFHFDQKIAMALQYRVREALRAPEVPAKQHTQFHLPPGAALYPSLPIGTPVYGYEPFYQL